MESLLSIKNLTKYYEKRLIFNSLNISIEAGKFYTLLGANGAGKSTLLKILSGTELADSGDVLFHDKPIQSWDIEGKSDLFYINENIQIETALTLKKFTEFFKELFPRWDESFFKLMIKSRKFDLDKFYHQCSRGQKMQFNMMLALAAGPKLLLLDEITSVMDVYTRRYFLQLLHEFTLKGGTVVMTTNIISELQFYTNHLFLIQDGGLLINGPLQDVKKDFIKIKVQPEEVLALLNHESVLWAGMNDDGSNNFLVPIKIAQKFNVPESRVNQQTVTMEDIFIYFSQMKKSGSDEDAA